jgi:hypothetical protein
MAKRKSNRFHLIKPYTKRQMLTEWQEIVKYDKSIKELYANREILKKSKKDTMINNFYTFTLTNTQKINVQNK